MTRIVSVPGIGNSGPDHWQTAWEAGLPDMVRFKPSSWDTPELQDWIEGIERSVAHAASAPILVCHSLGCLAFLHWARQTKSDWLGAMLVAVPDSSGPNFPGQASGFAVSGLMPLGKPLLTVASSDDPYDPAGNGVALAGKAGAAIIRLGARGHLNEKSGVADWAEGLALFTSFGTGLSAA